MPSTTIPIDTTSPAYKKAWRQHVKSTNNREKDVELAWTPFRAAEKKYKARFPPPDLSHVLDLAASDDTRADEVNLGGWHGISDALEVREVQLKSPGQQKAYTIPRIPGASQPFVL